MQSLNTLLAALALAIPASAQAINETFEYSTTGNFPPTGWAETNANGGTNLGWEDPSVNAVSGYTGMDSAGHDDYLSGVTNNFILESPAVDLSAYGTPELNFEDFLYYAAFTVQGGSGDGVSTVEISTDGGATWTVVWTETSAVNGTFQINVDLSAYANQSNVTVGFRYYGTYAHCWVVDNVLLDNGGNPSGPSLSVSAGAPGGAMTFDFGGYTPSSAIGVVYGPAGSYTVPGGSCAGLTVNLLPLNFPPASAVITLASDGSGNAQLTQNVPAGAAGLTVQAADVATCTASNSIVL